MPRPQKIFSKELETSIIEEYLNGTPVKIIYKKYGCTNISLHTILNTNKITKRKFKTSKIGHDEEMQLCNEYLNSKITLLELSKKYNISLHTIGFLCRRNNIEKRSNIISDHVFEDNTYRTYSLK